MPAPEPAQLLALRHAIAALETVKCRMVHERVRLDPETGRPVAACVADMGYQRTGFCTKDERARRLACGHTMARYTLEKGIDALPESERAALAPALQAVTNEIHSLDHQKGDAEKHVARLIDGARATTAERQAAQAAVRAIEQRHDACVERIADIQREVLVRLDALLGRSGGGVDDRR